MVRQGWPEPVVYRQSIGDVGLYCFHIQNAFFDISSQLVLSTLLDFTVLRTMFASMRCC